MIDHKLAFLASLEAIPSHHESHETRDTIAQNVAAKLAVDLDVAAAYVSSVVHLLDLFDALERDGDQLKLRNQITSYFTDSLAWYVANDHTLVSNWDRLGTSRNLGISHLLDAAPYFFRIMEERRVTICAGGPSPQPTREQACSVILIKGKIDGIVCLLYQWDQNAERYQLIGGKCRPNESYADTARREFQEEISDHSLVYGRDFDIAPIGSVQLRATAVSRTYGALTAYRIAPFKATINTESLTLSAADRWISLEEARRGYTVDNREVSPIVTQLEALVPGAIEQIPISVVVKRRRVLRDALEIRPSIWGITFDLKKLFFGDRSK